MHSLLSQLRTRSPSSFFPHSEPTDRRPRGGARLLGTLLAGAVLLVGCEVPLEPGPGGDDGGEDEASVSLQVTPSEAQGVPGDTLHFEAAVTDEAGESVSGFEVSWASSDTALVTIADGVATVRDSGAATVTATATDGGEELTDSAQVEGLAGEPESVEVSPSETTVAVDASVQLEATVRDGAGNELTADVGWSSSDTAVATVAGDGTVTGRSAGSATIEAVAGEATDSAGVTVQQDTTTDESPPDMPGAVSITEQERSDTAVTYSVTWGAVETADRYDWSAGSNNGVWSDSGSSPDSVTSLVAPRSGTDDDSFFCAQAVNDAGGSENRCNAFTVPAEPGDSSGGGDDPQPGALEVSTSTTGDDLDPDGYTVSVDGDAGQAIGIDATVTFSELAAGDRSVALSGVADNCSVAGANPRTVAVPEGGTASTTFEVACEATGGGGDLAEVAIPSASEWSGATRILSPGGGGAWDARFAGPAPASVIKRDGTYYLYYVGAAGDRSSDGGPANRAVGLATSTDGSTWTKHPDNPVVPWSDIQNNSVEEEGAWGAAAYVDGDEILLYVADLVGSGGGSVNGDIRLFTSTDGVNFADQGIVLDHDSSFPGDDEVTPVGLHEDADGTWHLYYVAKGGGTFWDLAHASGPSRDNFTSAEVVRSRNSEDDTFRYGGDVALLRDGASGVKIGLMMGGGNEGDHEYYTFEDTDFTSDTFEHQYSWGSEGAAHYLDRSTSTWLTFHNDGSDDNDGIYLRTAPVRSP